jgi:hypothetical protein
MMIGAPFLDRRRRRLLRFQYNCSGISLSIVDLVIKNQEDVFTDAGSLGLGLVLDRLGIFLFLRRPTRYILTRNKEIRRERRD